MDTAQVSVWSQVDTSSKAADRVPVTRRIRTLQEKLQILAEAEVPGASVATVARNHGLNGNVLFGWRRLQRRGLLEGQRHAPALLPVRITEPTITPTRRASKDATPTASTSAPDKTSEGVIEIILIDQTRIRLSGAAQRAVLARVLEWLPRR